MQRAMDRLSGFVRRRRRLVLARLGRVLLASLPFAARQTENLTGGGFEVPGTGSVAVEEQIERFEGASSESLAVVLEGREATRRGRRPRPGGRRRASTGSRCPDDVSRAGDGQPRSSCRWRSTAAATRRSTPPRSCARSSRSASGRRRPGVRGRPVGAVGGHAGAPAGGPREGRGGGLPGDPDRAAGGLRLAAGRAAAGRPRRRRGGRHRRRRVLPRAGDHDVGLRDQRRVDARHRRRGRLLAVPALALPRGGARGRRPRARARCRHADLRARPSSSPA